jgi:hypothetical protein
VKGCNQVVLIFGKQPRQACKIKVVLIFGKQPRKLWLLPVPGPTRPFSCTFEPPDSLLGAVQKLRHAGAKSNTGPGPGRARAMAGLAPAEAMGAREPALRISYPNGAGPPGLEPPPPDRAGRGTFRGGRARAQGPSSHPRAAPPASAPSAGSPRMRRTRPEPGFRRRIGTFAPSSQIARGLFVFF